MRPAISVICTFLNAEDTIRETLESLVVQSMAEAYFVLVDDGSTDLSATIAEHFTMRDTRFVLQRNPSPGRVRALNLAVAATEFEYLAVLDADDVAHPDWLADAVAAMRANPEFAVIGFQATLYSRLRAT